MSLVSNPKRPPIAGRFWVGHGPDERILSAEELLVAFEEGHLDGRTPVRIRPGAPPRPLAKLLREIVWMARWDQPSTVTEMVGPYAAAFHDAPVGVVLSDLAGVITHANTAFATMLGYEPDALVGLRVGELSHPDERAAEVELGNALIRGTRSTMQLEKRFLDRSGTPIETLTTVSLTLNDAQAPTGAIAHVLDLRELRQLQQTAAAEARAREASEQRFERVFLLAPQPMLMVSAEQVVLQSNLRARALFGYDATSFAGLPLDALVPEASKGPHQGHVAGYFSAESARDMAPGRQVHARRQDGSTFLASIGLVPLEVAGRSAVLVGITDVTEEVAAKRDLAASLAEKELLLKEVHHRVKNHLHVLGSLLKLEGDQVESEAAKAALEISTQRVQSVALIHQHLYGMASLAHVDLGLYAHQLGHALQTTFAPTARVRVTSDPVYLTAETAAPIGLILNELITNAFKYGGRASEGTTSAADVEVEIRLEADALLVRVTDQGTGLPDTLDLTRNASLGMTLVHALTKQLRGVLTFERRPGTCATLRLPRPPDPHPA